MQLAAGNPDSAAAAWRNASGESSRFWYAVAIRGANRARGDSPLRAHPRQPGLSFSRRRGRQTLGAYGWARQVPGDPPAAGWAGHRAPPAGRWNPSRFSTV